MLEDQGLNENHHEYLLWVLKEKKKNKESPWE